MHGPEPNGAARRSLLEPLFNALLHVCHTSDVALWPMLAVERRSYVAADIFHNHVAHFGPGL